MKSYYKLFFIFLLAFVCFFGIDRVYAETNRMYMSYDSTLLEIGDTRVVSTTPSTITNQITYSDLSTNFDTYSTLYARYSFCSTSDLFSANSQVINTNIKCSNNGSIGTLSFFTMSFNENNTSEGTYNPDTSVSTFIYNTSFDIYSSYSDTLTLYGVDVGRSLSDFPSYDSNSDVLDKLDSLNSSVISNLHNIQNTNEKILLYVLSIYQNMVTCRDSYNLLSSSFVQKTSNALTSDIKNLKSGSYTFSFDGNLTPTWQLSIYKILDGNRTSLKYNYNNYNITFYLDEVSDIQIEIYKSGILLSDISKTMLNSGTTSLPYEEFGSKVCKSKVDETNDAINQSNKKLDETNSKLDDANNFMKDDDVSDSENTAGGFFNDFSTTDNGGISGIITMPLKMINGLISGGNSCNELSFTILGKEVAFPSGCILWNKADNSVVILYQTLVCGFFGYILLIKLFNDIQNLKNPNSSEVSTLDL